MTTPSDNSTYIAGFVCTLKTCSVKEWGYIHYQPSMAGNILFLGILAILAGVNIFLGIRYKTRLICTAMVLGLVCEVMGYIARVLMHGDPFDRDYFLWYLICLTIGPVFLAAAIYLCLSRIVVVYGEANSRLKPKTYSVFFLSCDFVSLVIQAVGGGIAASYPVINKKMINLGTHILVAGLSFQVASLFAFSVCAIEFLIRVHRNPSARSTEHADLYEAKKFKLFLHALGLATVLLFIRTVFRSVELSEGFSGHLANNEIEFMVLDGVMVILASITLTVFHPGRIFGKEKWAATNYQLKSEKHQKRKEQEVEMRRRAQERREARLAHFSKGGRDTSDPSIEKSGVAANHEEAVE